MPAEGAAPTAPALRRRKLLLGCFSLLLSLLLAEGALRLTGIAGASRGSPWFAGGNHPRFLFQPDPQSGYTLRPGFRGREIAPAHEFDVPVTVDADGLRDHRHVAPPDAAVLALGDSMSFGEGVGAEEAWPAVLERVAGVRVYDAGVPGFGSPQMRARLQRLLPRLRPRLVLVALSPHWDEERCAEPFVYEDGYIVASGYAEKLRVIDGNLYLADVKWPVVGPATAYAKRWSYLARLLLPATRRAAGVLAGERRRAGHAAGVLPSAAVLPSAEALAAMKRDAESAGARLLVILLDSRGPDYEADRDALEAELARRGVPFVALDSLLAGADWRTLRFPHDQHWNATGHRAVGEALRAVVRQDLERDLR
jgi:hypothetical protein